MTRAKQKDAAAEVKPGMSVVVDARGGRVADLIVLEVKSVPPPAKKTK